MIHLAGWLGGLAVILVPGLVLATLLGARRRLAESIGLGLGFWPILFLWSSTVGIPWTATGVRVLFAAMLIAAVMVGRGRPRSRARARSPVHHIPFLVLLILTVMTRLVHIRDIVAPLWVDSVHHTMITRLILEQGSIPTTYEPFIDNSVFSYHWGFHVVLAVVARMTGITDPFDLIQLLLAFGQLLNALVFVVMYAAGRALFSSRSAGLIAATLACLVSYYPAYYVSWGRYTHLAGLLILVPFAIVLARAAKKRAASDVLALALLSAALVLVHVRIAVFAATFAVSLLLMTRRDLFRVVIRWSAAAALALLITMPWLLTLRTNFPVAETANVVPADILWSPNNIPLMILGSAGTIALLTTPQITLAWRLLAMAWFAVLMFAVYRRSVRGCPPSRAFRARVLLMVTWSALTVVVINAQWFGLPRIRPLPNSAALITMFIPLSLLASGFLLWLLRPRRALIAAAFFIGIGGAWSMRAIVNPATVLVTDADIRALRWIRDNTSPAAVFAVTGQPWLSGSWMGVDGGYWITALTDRQSILPPGLYAWSVPEAERVRINRAIERWRLGLSQPGVTHAYFGPKNTSPVRRMLDRPIYERDGVSIFLLE